MNRFSVMIITGGSSGIGCALIKAVKNINPNLRVCNLSRSKPDDFFGLESCHLPVDLTDPDALAEGADQAAVYAAESGPGEILLVNNSGFGDYGRFHARDRDKQLSMMDLNMRAAVDLTARLLPLLLERGGVVMNIASTAGFQPTPFLATYGATKAFLLHWSLALHEDLRGTGVRALAVCPGPTRSNFFRRAGFDQPPVENGGLQGRIGGMSADAVAQQALRALCRGRVLLVTGLRNKVVAFLGAVLPKTLVSRVGGWVLGKLREKPE